MLLGEMYVTMETAKEGFRERLEKNDGNMKEFLKTCLDKCCSQFEEDTLRENLVDEFQDYMNRVKVA